MITRTDKLEQLLELNKAAIAVGNEWAKASVDDGRAQNLSESYAERVSTLKKVSTLRATICELDEAIRELVAYIDSGEE